MALNTIATARRTAGIGPATAGGGFTLPQNAFLPHPSTTPFGNGNTVQSPNQTSGRNNQFSRPVTVADGQPSNNRPAIFGIVGFAR